MFSSTYVPRETVLHDRARSVSAGPAPYFRPHPLKPVRYPWRPKEVKAMTIALGILTHDSVVIAADSEVGNEYSKMDEGKISWAQRTDNSEQNGAIVVTGAGGR